MLQAIAKFFDSGEFMPHGHCFLWEPDILWLHIASDAGIVAAYLSIPFALLYFIRKRTDMPFQSVFILFGAFILLCGTTHLMSIWVLWNPDYAIEGIIKAATAIASIATFFVLVKLIPQALALPSPSQLAAVNQELREANAKLELLYAQSEENGQSHLRAVVNNVLDGLITIDEKGNIESFNPACERIFGYKALEVMGKNIKILMPEPYHSGHDGYLTHYLATGEPKIIGTAGREVKARRKDGSIFPMDLSVSAFQYDGARHFSGIIRDITERKEAEVQRKRYMQELERSNQELDDFAYIASHDLKEPLRGLFNNSRFLQEDYADKLDSEGVKRLQRLGYLSQRMEQLVNDLLYFSRLGRQELAIRPTNLNAMIHDIASLMETTLKEEHARITIPLPLPEIVCDQPRITEVFRNLITNAVKYNDSDTKIIEIGYREHMGTDNNVFYVKDNGIGIAPEFHEEIFRIFRRLSGDKDGKSGTGVGLTFVRKIIERHGGKIWLESTPGKGSAFYFTIG
jgi:two-component system sensor kinase FixL